MAKKTPDTNTVANNDVGCRRQITMTFSGANIPSNADTIDTGLAHIDIAVYTPVSGTAAVSFTKSTGTLTVVGGGGVAGDLWVQGN